MLTPLSVHGGWGWFAGVVLALLGVHVVVEGELAEEEGAHEAGQVRVHGGGEGHQGGGGGLVRTVLLLAATESEKETDRLKTVTIKSSTDL